MTDNTPVVRITSTVVMVMSVINDYGSGLAVVLSENDKYIGLVTDGDIRRAIIKGLSPQDSIESIVNKDAVFGKITDDRDSLLSNLSLDLKAIPLIDNDSN